MNLNISFPQILNIPFKQMSQPTPSKSKLERTPSRDSFEMTVGYVNDLHGQTNNMMRILSGLKGDLILSGGDNDIGDEKNRPVHDATMTFLNLANCKGTALGNHEMDTLQADLKESSEKFNGKILAINISQQSLETQPADDIDKFKKADINNIIKKSTIVDVKGEKVGLIGATPIDLTERCTHPDYHKDCSVADLEGTAELIQNEINELKKQGINKIILLSHLGHEVDLKIGQNTQGIDVIVGGHTHELMKGIKDGENLIYSKTGEPIIITEAGKDGRYFGELNLSFDSDGVITRAQNNLGKTSEFSKNLVNQHIFDNILGAPEQVGVVSEVAPIPKSLMEENPHANFMCDAMNYEMDGDIALWNNSGTRNYFKKGLIDSSDINEIAPFADNISVANVSEKTLVDCFKKAIEISYKSQGNKPGLIAVSGMKYTVDTKNKTLKSMVFVDKQGYEHNIDVKNPRSDKKYKVVADSFMMSWGADYDILSPKYECVEYPFNKAYLACEYIKHLNEPVVINQTGRILFE